MFTLPVCAWVQTYTETVIQSGAIGKLANVLAPFPDAKKDPTGFGTGDGASIWTQCIETGTYGNTKYNGTVSSGHLANFRVSHTDGSSRLF